MHNIQLTKKNWTNQPTQAKGYATLLIDDI
jgi:hypothetical protein